MNFAALLERNSDRATPSLRRTPKAHHHDNANLAGVHLSIARSCSDKPSQLSGRTAHPAPCSMAVSMSRILGISSIANSTASKGAPPEFAKLWEVGRLI